MGNGLQQETFIICWLSCDNAEPLRTSLIMLENTPALSGI
jgi:hypothetical protein